MTEAASKEATENGDDANLPTSAELSQLNTKIVKQVEYYFGDANLMRDTFLKEELKKDDGWIPMEIMLKFKRLNNLSTDAEVILKALQESDSDFMLVDSENKKIRRNPDNSLPLLTKDAREEITARTIYAKGFPENSTLDELLDYFGGFGEVESCFMRRMKKNKDGPDGAFKGSVFVQFKKKDDSDKFISEESVKYKDAELIRYHKKAYTEMKVKERIEAKQETANKKRKLAESGDSSANDSKKIKSDVDGDGDGNEAAGDGEMTDEVVKEKMTEGSLLKITGTPATVNVMALKEFFSKHGKVAWIDQIEEPAHIKVRFSEKGSAQGVLDSLEKEGEIKFEDSVLECSVLQGEAELLHWRELLKTLKARERSSGKGRDGKFGRRGRGRGRRGRGHGRGRNK